MAELVPTMDDSLKTALEQLKAAGAPVLPKHKTADAAPMGKVWSGKKADGGIWTLTKEGPFSYTWTC